MRPVSTYRLQFHAGFRFADARALVPYLHALGVTHCYASPILQARAGSQHGYDITDHNLINAELGTYEDFAALSDELRAHDMGLILDFVPNHMAIGHGTNPWWMDVLENGPSSEYADFFDIDWKPLKPELAGKVLLPILGDQYGAELEGGKLRVESTDGTLRLRYHDKVLPFDPQTLPLVFTDVREQQTNDPRAQGALAHLHELLDELRALPPHTAREESLVERRRQLAPELKRRFAALAEHSSAVRDHIARALPRINGRVEDARSFDPLHALLEAQAYRLAHWRVSAEEINYRRFFDVNDLAGVRMENPRVFEATHRLLRRLLADGLIQGLRFDHPDGLFNPPQYFARTQMLYAASQCCGAEPCPPLGDNGIEQGMAQVFGQHEWTGNLAPMYALVEKILGPGEELPTDWRVDGTVGYEFANLVNGIFIQPRSARAFTNLYQRLTGMSSDVDTLIYDCKKLIMDTALSSEVAVLTHMLGEICARDRRARDLTLGTLEESIVETIACFPVYRTYIDERGAISERDRGYITEAIVRAKRRNPGLPAPLFDFLRDALLLRINPTAHDYGDRLYFALKFQQLTGPVMAKGLEDTACYVYNRFVSVNDVGGNPKAFGQPVDEFHRANLQRLERSPYSLVTTSTHDTKRSEDVRARLNVLSEMPKQWSQVVTRWRRMNNAKKRVLPDGTSAPDANEEYLLYQTLAGTLPFRLDEEAEDYIARIQQYMSKALHEAKVNLSWINPNPEYVDAVNDLIARLLAPGTDARPNRFREELERFTTPVAFFGAMNSLAQALLKLTAPGVPDVYQGQELFDFSLVDPDNRRPVDFTTRERDLSELAHRASADLSGLPDDLLRDYHDGRIKLWTTQRALAFRRDHKQLFSAGAYRPLYGAVEKTEHLIAFLRTHERQSALVAVPRFSYTLMRGEMRAPLGDAWEAAELALPPGAAPEFENVLTGEIVRQTPARSLLCRELFARFPVALLRGL
ncbi:MAG: malto-oligosyltrehalose synthase [Candidatus Koribacter versatilis]|uniref:Malto-oligosyltrehalose synthase n=1 Tax=Candidatus Korobacter versatilis TaxID=658062 RepID=A0A932EP70_9BACT|nr:malto-oligosyltrehalose synthase [Candidatus Koribacter versatilis]